MHEVFTFSWSEDTVERDPWFLYSFFSVAFCCFFFVFFWRVVCDIALRFQWLWPPPFFFQPEKKTKNPHTRPPSPTPNRPLLPAALGRGNYALLSLPFVWGASLGTVFTSAVAFFTSASPLVLSSFTAFPLRQQTQERGRTIGETKKEERGDSVNGEPLSLSLTAKLSALSWLLCHFSKKERGGKKNGGKNMQDALREFVFPPGTECISHIMGSSSLS